MSTGDSTYSTASTMITISDFFMEAKADIAPPFPGDPASDTGWQRECSLADTAQTVGRTSFSLACG
jgi:hypothetical protein